jgi:hypothetical protein
MDIQRPSFPGELKGRGGNDVALDISLRKLEVPANTGAIRLVKTNMHMQIVKPLPFIGNILFFEGLKVSVHRANPYISPGGIRPHEHIGHRGVRPAGLVPGRASLEEA